jgi:hypothetical protein
MTTMPSWVTDAIPIPHDHHILHGNRDAILSIVVRGGHFGELGRDPFVFNFHHGIHLIIGDRGTGKSTIINLVSAVTPSGASLASSFVSRVFYALGSDSLSLAEAIPTVYAILREYRATSIAFLLRSEELILVFIVERPDVVGLFSLVEREWVPKNLDKTRAPRISVFRQGDIFRIADEGDNTILHGLFDLMDPEINHTRQRLIGRANALNTKMRETPTSTVLDDPRPLLRVRDRYFRLLRRLEQAGPYELRELARSVKDTLHGLSQSLSKVPVDFRNALLDYPDEFIFWPIRKPLDALLDAILASSSERRTR